jgi:crossover junction endodeoxyribonuclease RuvC
MTKLENRIILGIDPGTNVMGYGIIETNGATIKLLSLGVIKLNNLNDHTLKLKKIFEQTYSLLEQYKPDELAIEAPFFGKNIQSMLKLGRAQGVAIAAALSHSIPVFEYSPRKIKQSITGKGNASKEQVASMLQNLLHFDQLPHYLDATDGLAAAVCHFFQRGKTSGKKGYSGWNAFIKDNPGKKIDP